MMLAPSFDSKGSAALLFIGFEAPELVNLGFVDDRVVPFKSKTLGSLLLLLEDR